MLSLTGVSCKDTDRNAEAGWEREHGRPASVARRGRTLVRPTHRRRAPGNLLGWCWVVSLALHGAWLPNLDWFWRDRPAEASSRRREQVEVSLMPARSALVGGAETSVGASLGSRSESASAQSSESAARRRGAGLLGERGPSDEAPSARSRPTPRLLSVRGCGRPGGEQREHRARQEGPAAAAGAARGGWRPAQSVAAPAGSEEMSAGALATNQAPERRGAGKLVLHQGGREAGRPDRSTDKGLASSLLADYLRDVEAGVSRHWRYPSRLAYSLEQGLVVLQVRVRHDGQVEAVVIQRASGFEAFDAEAVRAVRQASPFAPPPPEVLFRRGRKFLLLSLPMRYRNPMFE